MAQNVIGDFEQIQESAVSAGIGANGKPAFRRVVELGAGVSLTASVSGPVVVFGQNGTAIMSTTNPFVVGGNVASGATDSGNPVKAGGVYNSTLPTLTNGQRGDLQVGPRGSLNVAVNVGSATSVVAVSIGAVAANALGANVNRTGFIMFNSTTQPVYVRVGSVSASLTDYSFQIAAGQTYEQADGYTGIYSVFGTVATGNLRVTEKT